MPYFPVVGDVIESRIVAYTPDQISINTIHWKVSNPSPVGTGANLEEMASFVDAVIVSQYKALMSSNARYRGVGCAKIDPPRTIEYAYILNDGPGTIVADLLPGQVTYVIQKRSVLAGPRNAGRIFPGFPPETANDADGTMLSTYAATVAALATQMNAQFFPLAVVGATGSTDFRPVIKHSAGFAYIDIDHFSGTTKWATQRRRGQYGRTNILPF